MFTQYQQFFFYFTSKNTSLILKIVQQDVFFAFEAEARPRLQGGFPWLWGRGGKSALGTRLAEAGNRLLFEDNSGAYIRIEVNQQAFFFSTFWGITFGRALFIYLFIIYLFISRNFTIFFPALLWLFRKCNTTEVTFLFRFSDKLDPFLSVQIRRLAVTLAFSHKRCILQILPNYIECTIFVIMSEVHSSYLFKFPAVNRLFCCCCFSFLLS